MADDLPTEGVLATHYPNNGRPWSMAYLSVPAISVAEHERRMAEQAGEIARKWVGEHFREIKQAITTSLTHASVSTAPTDAPTVRLSISEERAGQLATLVMAGMSHVYPDAPWKDEIDAAVREFGFAGEA